MQKIPRVTEEEMCAHYLFLACAHAHTQTQTYVQVGAYTHTCFLGSGQVQMAAEPQFLNAEVHLCVRLMYNALQKSDGQTVRFYK